MSSTNGSGMSGALVISETSNSNSAIVPGLSRSRARRPSQDARTRPRRSRWDKTWMSMSRRWPADSRADDCVGQAGSGDVTRSTAGGRDDEPLAGSGRVLAGGLAEGLAGGRDDDPSAGPGGVLAGGLAGGLVRGKDDNPLAGSGGILAGGLVGGLEGGDFCFLLCSLSLWRVVTA